VGGAVELGEIGESSGSRQVEERNFSFQRKSDEKNTKKKEEEREKSANHRITEGKTQKY